MGLFHEAIQENCWAIIQTNSGTTEPPQSWVSLGMAEIQNMYNSLLISGKSTHLIERLLLHWPTSLYVSEWVCMRVRGREEKGGRGWQWCCDIAIWKWKAYWQRCYKSGQHQSDPLENTQVWKMETKHSKSIFRETDSLHLIFFLSKKENY